MFVYLIKTIYIFILQFLDTISSKLGIYVTFSTGLIFVSFSPLFLYPCPPIPKTIISIIIGLLLIGVGTAPVFIPGLVALSKNIRKIDPNIDELTANDISSAINNLTLDLGEFIGPIIGGFFTSRYNFKYCCFFVFLFGIVISGLFFLFFFSNIKDDLKILLTKKQNIEGLDKNIIKGDVLYNNNDNSDQVSCNSFTLNRSFMGSFKFESISKRRNSYTNLVRRTQRLSKSSLNSALTD